jgi:metallo-beta-lactamase family protein
MHLVETGSGKILLDCGLFLGPRTDNARRSLPFPFRPADVDAVLLSHAHIDHCGNLPHLVVAGFTGPIYCTPPTRDLLNLMLTDSARIQEEDAHVRSILGQPAEPVSTRADVCRTLQQCVLVPYGQMQEISPGVRFRFEDAGHILGSAMVALTVVRAGREHTLTFTGDLGRPGMGFLRDPAPVPAADLLICESTYGGCMHDSLDHTVATLEDVVRRTSARGGKVLVPAFSLGRMQLVVHYLVEGIRSGRLPSVPLWVDSALAADIAEVHRRYQDCLAERDAIPGDSDADGPGKVQLHYVRTAEESKEVSSQRGPAIIVASGGMCEGGRIVPHLQQHIDDPRCFIVLVSYQASHTLGRRLLARGPTVRFRGRTWNKWADIVELNGFSGHADHSDFLAALAPLAGRVRKVRLVHGETERAEALAQAFRQHGLVDVAIPARGDTVCLP